MESNDNFKSGFVSMLGRTNVGKSSIINALVGEKVAAVANKTQTTRTAIRAIVNRPNLQVIFVDTPGIHKPKSKLGDVMVETAFGSSTDVDIILFVYIKNYFYSFFWIFTNIYFVCHTYKFNNISCRFSHVFSIQVEGTF